MFKDFPNWHEAVFYKLFIKLHTGRSDENEPKDLFPDVKEDLTELGWKTNHLVKWMPFQSFSDVVAPPRLSHLICLSAENCSFFLPHACSCHSCHPLPQVQTAPVVAVFTSSFSSFLLFPFYLPNSRFSIILQIPTPRFGFDVHFFFFFGVYP